MYAQKLKRRGLGGNKEKENFQRRAQSWFGQEWTVGFINMEVIVDLANGCLGKIIRLLTEMSSRQNWWRRIDEWYYKKLV